MKPANPVTREERGWRERAPGFPALKTGIARQFRRRCRKRDAMGDDILGGSEFTVAGFVS